MKHKLCLILSNIVFFSNYAATWQPPAKDRKYNEVTYLVAHDAFASRAYGYTYAQQSLDLKGQLKAGARGFKFVLYKYEGFFSKAKASVASWFNKKKKDNKKSDSLDPDNVRLCHGTCDLTATVLRPTKGDAQKFQTILLGELKPFLENNPNEIITIILENYVTDPKLVDATFKPLDHLIFRTKDKESGPWPTLETLIKKNKRLIIFADANIKNSDYMFDQWKFMMENNWGTHDKKMVCEERRRSELQNSLTHKNRYLYFFNFFLETPLPTKKKDYAKIKSIIASFKQLDFSNTNAKLLPKALENCVQKYNGRYPNFIAVDFVDKGNPIKLVNQINDLGQNIENRQKMYAPLN